MSSVLPPRLLRPLSLPLRLMPTTFHSRALARILNQVMKEAIADGELDFLEGRQVAIEIADMGVRYRLGFENGRIQGYGEQRPADASIAGDTREFMMLAARQEDADTLFFQRRLRMSGSTELGLYLKNFLDAFEPPERWQPLTRAIDRMAGVRFPGH
ncbi:SCP2 sterol-binding domain-containing protein [Marichromatium gracile]|uniref:Ubiquinone biosynthesis accessory factor UbiT n=2 Tax=Marichromatium TaxID=85076 RepID=W0E2R6_MARPU|nr:MULTISPECIES: SCP2 sterol-binding domain-containing protein [Marichromatium]MBO8087235.1 SCP2 sterol-binding domain-containing protein [Marichromatium sp.]AHF03519.1 sterol-binding protein [Marichromatium purpuratum 984]KXX65400.1 sterol-binding protein [Marichromatium gracile]MBK1708452.1 sterol-binding protein [Marichromatium gracile]MCF1183590.1 SCP2 sterol-binding domain-containing protein [Marichromatium gracile]